MRVGFLSNQLDNRGTGNAMFDYAKYNKDLLGNESAIFTYGTGKHSTDMILKYTMEFGEISYIPGPQYVQQIDGIDALYHIKYGNDDGVRTNPAVRYCVHSVFQIDKHGDRYATVSRWLSGDTGVPFVPHVVQLPDVGDLSFRPFHDIPKDAVVFGRYGGFDTFDISWVWDVIEKILDVYPNVYFLFANTQPALKHPRIIYREELLSPITKALFVNSCDYMLHARHRGETFGISVGEFAIKGKPIITYGGSGERAHLDILNVAALIYNDQFDLYKILSGLSSIQSSGISYSYTQFSVTPVMEKFNEVFLS